MQPDKMRTPDIKCVLLGDSQVGKTALLFSYATNSFEQNRPRTFLDSYEVTLRIKHKDVVMGVFDTAGERQMQKLRSFAFPGTDVFVVCFSVEDRQSFRNVYQWTEDFKEMAPDTPFILVATKKDLRDSQKGGPFSTGERPFVTKSEGEHLADKLGAIDYFETSSRNKEGVKDVFDEVIVTAIAGGASLRSPKKKCNLL